MAKAAKAKTKTTTSTKKVTKKPSSTAKRVATKKTKAADAASQQFFEFRITEQTLYWLLFGAVAISFTLWLFTLDARVRDLYDQIDANMNTTNTMLESKDT